jgi:MFS transporter, DHA1 family, multidrug resistance protein
VTSSRRIVTFSLLMLCAVLSLSGTDLILPAVPALPGIFATDEATAQLVLAAYAGGTGLGLLLFGRLGDRFERKPLLLASLALFAAASIACAFAPTIEVLIVFRLVQGAASAAAPVFGPGIIRQLFSDKVALRAVGLLGSVESLVPALAPIMGVYLLAHFGWRSSFELVGAMAILVALLILMLGLPRQEQFDGAQGTYRQLLCDRVFMRYALTQALTLGGLVAFTFGAPVVIVTTMGGTLDSFIVMQVCCVAGFIVAANLTARVAERFGTERVILFGTAMGAASALAILGYGLAGGRNAFWLPVLFLPMGVGLGLRGPLGFYRGVVASGNNNARGAALIVFLILMVTMLGTAAVAPVITMGLPALALVVSAIHLLSVGLLLGLPAMSDP